MFSRLLFLILIVCSGFKLQEDQSSASIWVIRGVGSLNVSGSTNVNKFSCGITNFLSPDTLIFNTDHSKESIKVSGLIELDINRFDCKNVVMTRDLRKALKANDFPTMKIRFLSLDWYSASQKANDVKGMVAISLAGVTKKFEVSYTITHKGQDAMELRGRRRINFSDFRIVPPGKLGGLVKTHNNLDVEFNLGLVQL